MISWILIIRTLHILSGALWLGEIMVINFILIPALSKASGELRVKMIRSLFPMVFRVASVLAFVVVITGVLLLFQLTNGDLAVLTEGRWGLSILVGGCLACALAVFHFFIEHRLAKKLGFDERRDQDALGEFHLKLKIVPRIGMIIIAVIFLLMINAARGLF